MHRILIIDDDAPMRAMLRETFALNGYAVDTAANGLEAEPLYNRNRYDVIITDIVMPEKDGIEVILDLLRRKNGARVIAISGGGRVNATDYLVTAEKFGVSATFQKPIDRKALLAKVRDLCAESSVPQ